MRERSGKNESKDGWHSWLGWRQGCSSLKPPGCLQSPAVADTARDKFSSRDETTSYSTLQAVVGSAQLTGGTDSGAVEPTSKQSKAKPQAQAQHVIQQTPPVS